MGKNPDMRRRYVSAAHVGHQPSLRGVGGRAAAARNASAISWVASSFQLHPFGTGRHNRSTTAAAMRSLAVAAIGRNGLARIGASQRAPPKRTGERDGLLELASIDVDFAGRDEGGDDPGDEGLLGS
jgi:hypothetical protein